MDNVLDRNHLLALVGSTASGKTDIAVSLATQFSEVELVSIDSMTIYRMMDIGTAKPSELILDQIQYHMINVVDPWEQFSLSEFQRCALDVVADIRGRGHIPLLVGGTGLYFQALVDEMSIPGQWPEIRAHLEDEASSSEGLVRLYQRLELLDPAGASKMEPGNSRRIIRALEVTLGSGVPFSQHGPGLFSNQMNSYLSVVGINMPRLELYDRIELRLSEQLERGWLNEVEMLLSHPLGMSRTAKQALGYKELIEVINGSMDLELAKQQILSRSKRLAKRQVAWFSRDPRVRWFETRLEAKRELQSLITKVLER